MLHSVRGRFLLIISFLVASVFLVFFVFSLRIIRLTMDTKEQDYMRSSVSIIAKQMNQEYQHIVQITQHMTSQGIVGKQLSNTLSAKTMFDLGEEKRLFDTCLQTITAIGSQVELALYYEIDQNEILTSTFPTKKTFSLTNGLNIVSQTPYVIFHAIHISQSRFSNHPVLSVSRLSTHINEKALTVYVEVRTSILDLLKEIKTDGKSNYTLLQLAQDGKLCYCSDPDFNAYELLAQIAASSDAYGFTGGLMWSKATSDYMIDYILLKPKHTFYASLIVWAENLATAFFVVITLLLCSIIIFNRTILQKLQVMMETVDAVSRPELVMTHQRTGIIEYDKLMDRFTRLLEYAQRLIAEVRMHEKENTKLELEKLYYQINPHFLMNSLNTLYWMVKLDGQKNASDYVHRLMGLLSYSLGKTGKQSTLRREIEVIRSYLSLEKERRAFSVTYEIEEGVYLDTLMPKLFLQPLVENAINHGIDTDGHLFIKVKTNQTSVLIVVEDDGCGIEPDKLQQLQTMKSIQKHGGIGLRYSVSMLKQFFGDNASIKIESAVHNGTKVTIKLDLWKEESSDSGTDHR